MLLRDMKVGDHFRTLLTDRVGVLRKKGNDLQVAWKDLRGPRVPHRNLIVEPWPKPKESRDVDRAT
jgi:hypothetical protein